MTVAATVNTERQAVQAAALPLVMSAAAATEAAKLVVTESTEVLQLAVLQEVESQEAAA